MNGFVKAGDRWILPIMGQEVRQLCFDFAATLNLENDVSVRIEQPFVITSRNAAESLIIPGGEINQLAPMLGLMRSVITQGLAFEDGHLELTFADGTSVLVPSTEDYEPWEIVGPQGLRIVSVPGGSLSIWQPGSSQND